MKKSLRTDLCHLLNFGHLDYTCSRDKVNRVASRRSSCHGFCTPPRQLYRDTTNPAHLSGPRHLDSFIVTPNTRPLTGTLQKHMPTLTRTATHIFVFINN